MLRPFPSLDVAGEHPTGWRGGPLPPAGDPRVQSQRVETPKAQAVRLALGEPTGMGFLSCVNSALA